VGGGPRYLSIETIRASLVAVINGSVKEAPRPLSASAWQATGGTRGRLATPLDGTRPPDKGAETFGTTIRIACPHHPSCLSRMHGDLRFF
jgi:hypothetical protein